MLHILLLILKIIGIILAAVLGILVLLVCVVLFLPIKYDAEGTFCEDKSKIYGMAKARWLFGLISIKVIYQEQKMDYILRIAWKKIRQSESGEERDHNEKENAEHDAKKENKKDVSQKQKMEQSNESSEKNDGGHQESKEINHEESDVRQVCEKNLEKIPQIHEEKRKKGNLKCTWKKLCDKIKEISDKKDKVSEFLSSEVHKGAFGKIKEELLRLVKRLRPKKLNLTVEYGFEDPSMTGYTLALFGVMYPLLGGNVDITPDFQNKVFRGNGHVKGRIYIFHFVCIAVKLLLSKNVRQSYHDIRQIEL